MGFGAGFPLILLLLLTLIQKNVPVEVFVLDQLVPGIAVFGYSFFALFSALLISRDRSSALMMRLMSSPMRPAQFLAGYALPLIPMAVVQTAICFGAAFLLGLQPTIRVLTTMIVLLPAAVMYFAIGFICGCLLDDRQVGGVCGAARSGVSSFSVRSGQLPSVSFAGIVTTLSPKAFSATVRVSSSRVRPPSVAFSRISETVLKYRP